MPETSPRAERKARAREAARRRQAAVALRVASQIAAYTAEQVSNGASTEQARAAVLDTAGELAELAVRLRRLARLPGPERLALAVQLAALGMPRTEIAWRLGVSDRAVWYYVRADLAPDARRAARYLAGL